MNNQATILLYDPNIASGSSLGTYLQRQTFLVDIFQDPNIARKHFERNPTDFCILNIEQTGFNETAELAKILRSRYREVAIIFTSSNHNIDFIAKAYALGADEYIRKPFAVEEILMRIMAIMRRIKCLRIAQMQTFAIGRYTLDSLKQTLTIDNKIIKLTTKECDLLVYLSHNINKLALRENILKNVWKNDSYYNARSMDVYITKLRGLLRDDQCVGIVNVHGKGYKLLVIDAATCDPLPAQ
jgi:DNA-binding response OmpR family regulator